MGKRTHGHAGSRTYANWERLVQRCLNKKTGAAYHLYGARGVKLCPRWRSSVFFADMGERPEGHTLVRHDPNGHYEPSNCYWARQLRARKGPR